MSNGVITGVKNSSPLTGFGQVILCGDVAFCSIGKRVLICKVPQCQQSEVVALLHGVNPDCPVLYQTAEEFTAKG